MGLNKTLVTIAGLILAGLVVGARSADDTLIRQPNLVYDRPDGQPLHLDFVAPPGDGPFPLVVCVHGGGWCRGSRTEFKDFQTNLARQGIASAAVQYRLAPHARFPAQQNDLRNALKFVLASPQQFPVDPHRILWMGGSAGGHLVLLAGLEKSDTHTTRLIINVAGPTDLRTFRSLPAGDAALKKHVSRDSAELLEDLLGTADRTSEIYRTASPVESVRADGPRVVTYHGEKDDIVPISQAEALHAKLRDLKASEKLFKAKTGGHDIGSWEATERLAALLDLVKEIQEAIKTN